LEQAGRHGAPNCSRQSSAMDAAYESQCAQVGTPAHPQLLRDFAGYDGQRPLCLGGGRRASASEEPPIRDADVVAVCLVVRSLAKLAAGSPAVHVDFTGELITCDGARTIAAVLQVSCGLRSLLLRRSLVSDEGAAALGAALGSSSLVELDLGECRISNAGARLFVRGVHLHGAPASLRVLLLDGNPMKDSGVLEIITLVEGRSRPPALAALSVQPAAPNILSDEVAAALQVVCDMWRVELRGSSRTVGATAPASCSTHPGGVRPAGWGMQEPQFTRSLHMEDEPHASNLNSMLLDRHGGHDVQTPPQAWNTSTSEIPLHAPAAASSVNVSGAVLPRRDPGLGTSPSQPSQWWAQQVSPPAAAGVRSPSLTTPDVRACRNSGHLAAWMASTERELRELKWLLGASAARLDSQHSRLMGELDKLRSQLDMWSRAGSAAGGPGGDEVRLEVLEARFDALEQLVGREQSECAQMWKLVEVAAGAAPATPEATTAPASAATLPSARPSVQQ